MLDRVQLLGLMPGDTVETVPLLPGLTAEPVTLVVCEAHVASAIFDVTLFGVQLARVEAVFAEDQPVIWRGVPA